MTHPVWLLILAVLLADRALKYFITKAPQAGVVLIPHVLKAELHKNFGIVGDLAVPRLLIIVTSLIFVAVLCVVFTKTANKKIKIALALIITGALSNLCDRILYGFVVDYALFFNLSYINLSDILIFIGVLILVV